MELVEKIIRPGIKIELRAAEAARELGSMIKPKYYISQISDVQEDGSVEAYMPLDHAKMVLLAIGSKQLMCCYAAGGMYECQVVVKDRYKRNGLYFVLFEVVSELRKNQRREYYRYKCMLPLSHRVLNPAEEKILNERKVLSISEEGTLEGGTILDISGGGMQFISKNKYQTGDMVYCRFSFGKTYRFCLEILGASSTDQAGIFRHRGRFQGMREKEREEIIRNIFMLERMKRKSNQEKE